MRLGLGSGPRRLGRRATGSATSGARPELVVCASPETARVVRGGRDSAWRSPEEAPELDLALDGADEVTRELAVLKGGGGALLREKLVIESAARCVIVAEARKLVGRLGEGWRLPVEVVRFGWEGTRARLLHLLDDARPRAAGRDGSPFVTDEGHYLLDCALPAGADLARAGRGRQGRHRRGRARPLPRARRGRRCWALPTARSSDWSGRELHRVPRVDVRRDHLLDDAHVLGMIGVDA